MKKALTLSKNSKNILFYGVLATFLVSTASNLVKIFSDPWPSDITMDSAVQTFVGIVSANCLLIAFVLSYLLLSKRKERNYEASLAGLAAITSMYALSWIYSSVTMFNMPTYDSFFGEQMPALVGLLAALYVVSMLRAGKSVENILKLTSALFFASIVLSGITFVLLMLGSIENITSSSLNYSILLEISWLLTPVVLLLAGYQTMKSFRKVNHFNLSVGVATSLVLIYTLTYETRFLPVDETILMLISYACFVIGILYYSIYLISVVNKKL